MTVLEQRYDRFAWAGNAIYNPFSILHVFTSGEFSSYSFATGMPTFLLDYLKAAHYNIPDLDNNVQINEAGA